MTSDTPQRLITDTPWPASPDRCPCDWDFVEWLAREKRNTALGRARTVFHMGTGAHHFVGFTVAAQRMPYRVIGLTASPVELNHYAAHVVAEPSTLHRYQVLFGDIYVFDPDFWLTRLDIVSLFHFCEFTDERRDAYGGWDDTSVLMRFIERTRTGGHILFYMGSVGYSRSVPIIQRMVDLGLISAGVEFKSLRVCEVLP